MTNYSINKKAENYVKNTDGVQKEGEERNPKDEEEMKADVADPNTPTTMDHIRQDTTVHVSPRGMNALQKLFKK